MADEVTISLFTEEQGPEEFMKENVVMVAINYR